MTSTGGGWKEFRFDYFERCQVLQEQTAASRTLYPSASMQQRGICRELSYTGVCVQCNVIFGALGPSALPQQLAAFSAASCGIQRRSSGVLHRQKELFDTEDPPAAASLQIFRSLPPAHSFYLLIWIWKTCIDWRCPASRASTVIFGPSCFSVALNARKM